MKDIRKITGAALLTGMVLVGSSAIASADVYSYQGDDYSYDYSSKHNIRNCDSESDSTSTKGIYDFNGEGGSNGNVSDQDGNNGVCASKATGGTIVRHRTCETPNWWPDQCGNWQST